MGSYVKKMGRNWSNFAHRHTDAAKLVVEMCYITVYIHLCYSVVNKKVQKLHLDMSMQSVTYSPLRTQCFFILLLRKIETSKTLYFSDVMCTTLEITLTMKNLNFVSSLTREFECCVTMKKVMSFLHIVRYGQKIKIKEHIN